MAVVSRSKLTFISSESSIEVVRTRSCENRFQNQEQKRHHWVLLVVFRNSLARAYGIPMDDNRGIHHKCSLLEAASNHDGAQTIKKQQNLLACFLSLLMCIIHAFLSSRTTSN